MVCTLIMGLETFFLESFLWLPLTYFYCGFVWEAIFQNVSFHKRTGGMDSFSLFCVGLVFCFIFILGGLWLHVLMSRVSLVFFGIDQ